MTDLPLTRDQIVAIAGHATIGNPVTEVQGRLDNDTE